MNAQAQTLVYNFDYNFIQKILIILLKIDYNFKVNTRVITVPRLLNRQKILSFVLSFS